MQDILFKPESSWAPPKAIPDLPHGLAVAMDLETCDPGLKSKGPGGIRGEGRVVGIALSCEAFTCYLPISHLGGGNLDHRSVVRYVQAVANVADRIVFANAQYDLEWLRSLGIFVSVPIEDVQIIEPLLDEEAGDYSLNALAKKYLGRGKDEEALKEAAKAYGVDAKAGLGDLPAKYVGAYAEEDARVTLQIYEKQIGLIKQRKLDEIYALETAIIPIVHAMRMQGVPVDLQKAAELEKRMAQEEERMRLESRRVWGAEMVEWSNQFLTKMADGLKLPYPKTEKGNPSFTSDFLTHATHPFLKLVNDIRDVNRHRVTFVQEWIFGNQHKGRVHARWHQMASDDGGTKTGRMSASSPNPQQIPRKSVWGKEIRACFIPESGKKWAKLDYSQQEPRILCHFASVMGYKGADTAVKNYVEGKDFYSFVMAAAGVTRDQSKTITLGRLYGMGATKLGEQLKLSEDDATKMLARFDKEVPFVKELNESVMNVAERRGYIRTLCGRHRHFDHWLPANDRTSLPLKREEAEVRWPKTTLRRAYTHKALNSLIQGSAADMTKTALLRIYQETRAVPYLQVHDELDYGVTDEAEKIKTLAENALKLRVPLKADMSVGENWK